MPDGSNLFEIKGKKNIKHRLGIIFDNRRLRLALIFMFIIGVIIFYRLILITIINGKEYKDIYMNNHSKIEWILPKRGIIYDYNGKILAKNNIENKREYPLKETSSHIIGYISEQDKIGIYGIEATYEDFLKGERGFTNFNINNKGEIQSIKEIKDGKAGNNLYLHIDYDAQEKLYNEVLKQVIDKNSPGGAAVLINPINGAIKALVSVPSFDNNFQSKDELVLILKRDDAPLFNRAISGEYPSGSTIKPFIAAAALSENIIDPNFKMETNGSITVQSIYNKNIKWIFKDWKNHGFVNMVEAIAYSSNVYFYTIGGGYKDIAGLGINKIDKYLQKFGMGSKTKIDIIGESKGLIPSPKWKSININEDWYIGDTYNTSIGQGFLRITPIQLASATSVIANSGTLYQPQIASKVVSDNGDIIWKNEPKILQKNIIKKEYLDIVKDGMRKSVTIGTNWRLNDLPKPVAAKTGSAEAGNNSETHSWVTVMSFYDDLPKDEKEKPFVLSVLVENGGNGETSAVPIAKNFLSWYLDDKNKSQEQ
ncbi:MAG: penicillin-binding transpeptidase domain-containing protein [Patescibacteria group bacterium]